MAVPENAIRACVVIPTYNNARTVVSVIEGARTHVADVIVVDDGSTDGTADALSRVEVRRIAHRKNLGKGAALLSAFQWAAESGFTHAITMDADGQHAADDLPAFLEAVARHPEALVVGTRALSGGGRARKSRLLRANSNFWVWAETGHCVGDTQSGFRAYPLAPLQTLRLDTRKYDLEVEALVKLIWIGTPVVSVPVKAYYGPGSESHFRPLADFALVARLNVRLLGLRLLLPALVRQAVVRHAAPGTSFRRHLLETLRDLDGPGTVPLTFALSVGVGVCFGILPIWGFQLAAAMVAAHLLRLSKPLTFLAANVSFPAAIPFILYASLLTGRFVLADPTEWSSDLSALNRTTVWLYAREYLVGSVVLAAACAVGAGSLAYLLAHTFCLRVRGARK